MEADSTTYENNLKNEGCDPVLPFPSTPSDLKLYMELIHDNGDKHIEVQIVERLQQFGLLPKIVECPTASPECKVVVKPARVIDRVQWVCECCGRRQPIRTGSIFLRLQCSLLQALQIILAWCKDADCESAAQHFGVKPKVANTIFNRMDDIAIKEQNEVKLGGDNIVVVTEMYPDFLTRLSPDTTDQPHMHRVLMVADTNHVPTSYQLHVIKDDLRKSSAASLESRSLIEEVTDVLNKVTVAGSMVVAGAHVPAVPATATIHQLTQYCDCEMQHFLSTGIWRGAVSLCAASRDLCAGVATPSASCSIRVQRYLSASLFRRHNGEKMFSAMLALIAQHHTQNSAVIEDSVVNHSGVMQCDAVINNGAVTQEDAVTHQDSVTQDGVACQQSTIIQNTFGTQQNVTTENVAATQQSALTQNNVEMLQVGVPQKNIEMQQDTASQDCLTRSSGTTQNVITQQGAVAQVAQITVVMQQSAGTQNSVIVQLAENMNNSGNVDTAENSRTSYSIVTVASPENMTHVITKPNADSELVYTQL